MTILQTLTEEMLQSARQRFPDLRRKSYVLPVVHFNSPIYKPIHGLSFPPLASPDKSNTKKVEMQVKTHLSTRIGLRTEDLVSRCLSRISETSHEPMFVLLSYDLENYLCNLKEKKRRRKKHAAGKTKDTNEISTPSINTSDSENQLKDTVKCEGKELEGCTETGKRKRKHITEDDLQTYFEMLEEKAKLTDPKGIFPSSVDFEHLHFHRGEYDALVISRQYGLIVFEIKTNRDRADTTRAAAGEEETSLYAVPSELAAKKEKGRSNLAEVKGEACSGDLDTNTELKPQCTNTGLEANDHDNNTELNVHDQDSSTELKPQGQNTSSELAPQVLSTSIKLEPQGKGTGSELKPQDQRTYAELKPRERDTRTELRPQDKDIITEPQEQDIITEPQEQDIITEPQEQDIITEPQEQDNITEPQEQDIITEPQEQDIITEPQEQDIITKPQGQSTNTELEPQDQGTSTVLEPQETLPNGDQDEEDGICEPGAVAGKDESTFQADLRKTLTKALKQLKQSGLVLQYLTSDFAEKPPITKVLALPYVSKSWLMEALQASPQLAEVCHTKLSAGRGRSHYAMNFPR